jgi:hypothetical protein
MRFLLYHCTKLTKNEQQPMRSSNSPSPSTSESPVSRKRSYSASTTSTKPQVDSVMGDMGIEITTSRLEIVTQTGAWTAKPRKQQKKQEPSAEFLCKECGTIDSPEWRRGPHGVKTLCNACGCEYLQRHAILAPIPDLLIVQYVGRRLRRSHVRRRKRRVNYRNDCWWG